MGVVLQRIRVLAMAVVAGGLMAAGMWTAGVIRGASEETPAAGVADLPITKEGRAEVMGLPAAPTSPATVEDLRLIQARVEAVAKAAIPATVAILLDGAQGSGVIVSKDGYVLTAGHVSGRPGTAIHVRLANGRSLKARSLGANNGIDSGMVKISDPTWKGDFPFVPVGTAKGLVAGQWVVAIGHPGGYLQDRPPVVRLGRVLLSRSQLIATDSPLISGDSGGPVFDLDGRLIGINSRIGATTTMNIHVPIDTFTETWGRLAKGEEWGDGHGFLGHGEPALGRAALGIRGLEDDKGVKVVAVHAKTAAEKAGLVIGDVITKLNGKAVKDPEGLSAMLVKRRPGENVTLDILRAGEVATSVTTAPGEEKAVQVTVKLGMTGR